MAEMLWSLKSSGGDYTSIGTWNTDTAVDLADAGTQVFTHGGITGTDPVDGETMTGGNNSYTGVVVGVVTDGTTKQILMHSISGAFEDGEVLTGGTGGGTVTLSGTGSATVVAVLEAQEAYAYSVTSKVTFANTTAGNVDATNYRVLRVASAYRHNGYDYTSGFYLTGALSDSFLRVDEEYFRMEYIAARSTYNGSNSATLYQSVVGTGLTGYWLGCLAAQTGTATNLRGFGSSRGRFYACMAIGCTMGFSGAGGAAVDGMTWFNCVAKDCDYGFDCRGGGDYDIRNSIAYGCTDSWNLGAGSAGSSTKNHADNVVGQPDVPGTSPGSTDLDSGDFEDAANDNMQPLSSASELHQVGTDLSGTFTDDIEGGSFIAANFNIGAWGTSHSADSTAPNLTLPTSASVTHNSAVIGATTDEDNGTAHAIITANGDESAPTNQEIIDGGAAEELYQLTDVSISGTGAFTFTALPEAAGLVPGTTYGYAIVHEDTAGNEDAGSRVEGTFTLDSAYAGSATYSGSTIPANSVLWFADGTQTAADDASSPDRLTDAAQAFTVDELIGMRVNNTTDGSSCNSITDNAATTVDGNLTGGSDNSWDQNDAYNITFAVDTSDVIWYETTTTVSSESATIDCYIEDVSASTYSDAFTVTITVSGASDGSYTVSLDTEGVPTLTPVEASSLGLIRDITQNITSDITSDLAN